MDHGLRTVEHSAHGKYLIFQPVAEMLMAGLVIFGGAGLLLVRSWAYPVTLFGPGMTVYSTINSLSRAVRYEPVLTQVLMVSLAIALAVIVLLERAGTRSTKGTSSGSDYAGSGIRAGITNNPGGEAG